MHLLSINLGQAQAINNGKPSGMSGIFKTATQGAVEITADGLQGDVILDPKNHGGPDQAVYIYGQPDYAWWAETLGYDLEAGRFGENLTISNLESATLNVGDRLNVGAVILEVTAPRIPCATLSARMGDSQFVKRFRDAERTGAYCRVISGGWVRAGDAVRLEPTHGPRVGIRQVFRQWYADEVSEADLRATLAAPLAIRARRITEKRLESLLNNA